jgi:cytochrome c oxidase assembly protein Cox11
MKGDDGDQVTVKDIARDGTMEDVQLCLSYTLFNMIKRRH